jgi:hypothetical protein
VPPSGRRASLQTIAQDCLGARTFLAAARAHLASAQAPEIDPSSAYLLAYEALKQTLDAALLADGKRVRGGDGAHAARVAEVRNMLPQEAALLARVDVARRQRNRTSYDAVSVGAQQLATVVADAHALIAAVEAYVDQQCP